MLVEVYQKARGDFVATVFTLPDGRVIVTDIVDAAASLFESAAVWERANGPEDALEVYDSVTEAFLDVLPQPEPIH